MEKGRFRQLSWHILRLVRITLGCWMIQLDCGRSDALSDYQSKLEHTGSFSTNIHHMTEAPSVALISLVLLCAFSSCTISLGHWWLPSYYLWNKIPGAHSSIISSTAGLPGNHRHSKIQLDSFLNWKNWIPSVGFVPTTIKDKWFQVNDLSHSARETHIRTYSVIRFS